MTAFQYTALDAAGKKHKGVMEADSPREARAQLRATALLPLQIDVVAQAPLKRWRAKLLSTKTLTLITRQMATLLQASIPIDEILTAVAAQSKQSIVKRLLLGVRAKVLEGHTLAEGLRAFAHSFPALYRNTIAAGEKSGKLDILLDKLADYTEQQYRLKQKILQALLYPAVMTTVSILIVTFLLLSVVPKIIDTFHQTQMMLPLSTRVLIAISHGLATQGVFLLLGLIASGFGVYRLLQHRPYRYRFHALLLRLPLLGHTLKAINAARFARSLGILTAASVPILEAMRAANALITLLPMHSAVEAAIQSVSEGKSLYIALEKTGYFSPMFIHLLGSGERSGQLDALLQRAADHQTDTVTHIIDNSLTLFEPLLILIMGGIVLFIVLAIMLPIFTLDQAPGL